MTTRAAQALGVEIAVRTMFDAPTIAGMARVVSEAKQGGAIPPLVRVPREGHLPLSFGQEQLWFLSQLDPESPFYNIPLGLRLRGALDAARLERSIDEVVRRHEILRTTYRAVEGKPAAVIHDEMKVTLPLVDLSSEPESQQEESVRRASAAELSPPFDLAKGPVLRVKLLRLAADHHVLLAVMHHIAVDAWTTQVLVEEVGAVYQALGKDEASPLAPLPIQYVDYAAWQRSYLQGETLERELSYWLGALEGAPTTLELPTDRPRPAVQTFRGSHALRRLSPSLNDATHAFCRAEGVTPYMVSLAIFGVLLWRYTGQDDVLVGTSRADRRHRETEPLVGYFLSQLVLRVRLSGDPTFRELLARVRETTLSAYAHRDLPFERIATALRPERDLSRSPIFQVMVDNPQAARFPEVSGLTIEGLGTPVETSRFDVTFAVVDRDGLVATAEYNSDLFDHATAERMLGHFETLLAGAMATPDVGVGDMEMMTESELAALSGFSAA